MLNRQQPYGADVISARVGHDARRRRRSPRSRRARTRRSPSSPGRSCEEAGVDPAEVYEIVVVGNVTMIQLALGIDPEPLSMAPFIVAAHDLPPATATDFGVAVHPRAPAVIFPSLGAYVGADIVAGMLATGLVRDKRLRLFIDVGTNSEIALGSHDRVLATAAPAGPAFEAAQIRCGMRAAEGAIEGVKIAGDAIELQVIGDIDPVGICGSGLVDCVAELVGAGLLDHSGRFVPEETAAEIAPALAERLTKIGEERVFMLADKRLPLAARRPRAAVRQGLDRDRLAHPHERARRRARGRLAGAAGRQLRRLPVAGERDPHRARAADGAAADRLGRQRRQRGREDGGAERARARRGAIADRTRSSTSSSPAARISTTCSSTSWRSRDDHDRRRLRRARGRTCKAIARRRGLDVEVHPLPALLHNRPELIAPAVEERALRGRATTASRSRTRTAAPTARSTRCSATSRGSRARTATTCWRASTRRPRSTEEPGTYFLTDFLARTFEHTVMRELGLDRHPELRDAYFGHYTRVLWLAQHPTPATRAAAERAAALLDLPLEVREVGEEALERQLAALLT